MMLSCILFRRVFSQFKFKQFDALLQLFHCRQLLLHFLYLNIRISGYPYGGVHTAKSILYFCGIHITTNKKANGRIVAVIFQ